MIWAPVRDYFRQPSSRFQKNFVQFFLLILVLSMNPLLTVLEFTKFQNTKLSDLAINQTTLQKSKYCLFFCLQLDLKMLTLRALYFLILFLAFKSYYKNSCKTCCHHDSLEISTFLLLFKNPSCWQQSSLRPCLLCSDLCCLACALMTYLFSHYLPRPESTPAELSQEVDVLFNSTYLSSQRKKGK